MSRPSSEPCLCGALDCSRCYPVEAGRYRQEAEVEAEVDRITNDAKEFRDVLTDYCDEADWDALIEILRLVAYEWYNKNDLSRRVCAVVGKHIELRAESIIEEKWS